MNQPSRHTFTINETLRRTERSILVRVTIREDDPIGLGGVEIEREVWLPLSQVREEGASRVSVPRWLARDRGLVRGSLKGRFTRYQEAI